MPTILKTKNSVTTTVVPTTLVQGELAVNITDKKMWVGNAASSPVQILGAGTTGTAAGSNTQVQYNSSGTLAGSSNFVFDGTNVGIGGASGGARLQITGTTNGASRIDLVNSTGSVTANFGAVTDGTAVLKTVSASPLIFAVNDTERMRITSAGNVGIGTSSPATILDVVGSGNPTLTLRGSDGAYTAVLKLQAAGGGASVINATGASSDALVFQTTGTERMRIDSSGNVLVAKTATNAGNVGCELLAIGAGLFTRNAGPSLVINRTTDDGTLVLFRQDNIDEGNISVSGSTVSYNGGHLSRWSQLPDNSKDDSIVKGTVMSNLDDMCVWEKDGVVAENEQLNKMKVSDVEGDTNVAGVFVNWTRDESFNSDDMNVAMTGDMIIRIADGVVVQKGDLLMSAGDGTAKPQGDDIVRSKTIAKVTSNYVTCTYADGSYCVPCVLMAC
jgi:hypothetical protein